MFEKLVPVSENIIEELSARLPRVYDTLEKLFDKATHSAKAIAKIYARRCDDVKHGLLRAPW